jgi:NAD(P)-dependent dehydrogenase (short-subunit alcohol dehydrogenase family)
MDLGLAGRVALVTGSFRGTGAGIARVLASEGAAVAVHGFEPGSAGVVADGIAAGGGRAAAVHGDILSDAGADQVVSQVADAFGPVDILVNNYGTTTDTSWDTPATGWHEGWERNVVAGVRLAQLTVPAMRRRGWGRVVFLGTIGTARPGERNPDYYGAKAALPALARSLAKRLRGTGVTVNVVSPGIIATDEVRARLADQATSAGRGGGWEAAQRWALDELMPNLTERIPDPDDIGRFVAFVVSEAAWHLNGADVRVDGGTLDA